MTLATKRSNENNFAKESPKNHVERGPLEVEKLKNPLVSAPSLDGHRCPWPMCHPSPLVGSTRCCSPTSCTGLHAGVGEEVRPPATRTEKGAQRRGPTDEERREEGWRRRRGAVQYHRKRVRWRKMKGAYGGDDKMESEGENEGSKKKGILDILLFQ